MLLLAANEVVVSEVPDVTQEGVVVMVATHPIAPEVVPLEMKTARD
jgi:hypothetical protein